MKHQQINVQNKVGETNTPIYPRLFGTDGIRGKANEFPMTPEIALRVGQAVAEVFKTKRNSRIVIGKDTRISGYMFESALEAGIVSRGVDVYLVGPLPTPAIAHLTKSMNASAGIVISASHNPYTDNGIKLFGPDGYKLNDVVEKDIEARIHAKLQHRAYTPCSIGKAYRIEEAQGRYIEYAKATIGTTSLQGMTLVLDCAHGAAYTVGPKIFSELGANVIVLNNEPDGKNINLNCGAVHPEQMAKAVKKYKADLGIALDGDADRIIVTDERGMILSGDQIICLLARDLLAAKKLNNKCVVITPMSNIGTKNFLHAHSIKTIEANIGDRYVIEEMRKHGATLGGEQSGHIIHAEHTTTGDGIIAGLELTRILKNSKKKLSALAKAIVQYPQALVNIKVKDTPLLSSLKAQQTVAIVERKLGNSGRVFVRYSGTEKVCRIMVEAKNKRDAHHYAAKIAKALQKEIGI